MKAKLVYIVCIMVIFQLTAVSQTEEWVAKFLRSGTYNSEIFRTEIDRFGNIYSISTTVTFEYGFDITLTKHNQSGVLQWAIHYNDSAFGVEYATSLAVDDSGFIYVGGVKETSTGYDIVLLKYRPDGSRQWAVVYNDDPKNQHTLMDMKVSRNGSIFLRDYTFGEDLYKYNAAGTLVWKRWSLAFPGYNYYMWNHDYIQCDRNGNVFIAGEVFSTDSLKICKYSDAGNLISTGAYKAPPGWTPYYQNIAIDSLDNIYVVCYIDSSDIKRSITVKFDNNCVLKWSKRIDAGSDNFPLSVGVDQMRNVYVVGQFKEPSLIWNYLTSYDSNGTGLWQKTFNTNSNDAGLSAGLTIDRENNVFYCGPEYTSGMFDIRLKKYNINGTLLWQSLYNGTGNFVDVANDIKTYDNNVYVSGYTIDSVNHNYKYGIVIKYAQPLTGINITNSGYPAEFSLSQNYPNPFNPSTMIRYDIPNDAVVKVKIYDILGKQVFGLDEFKKAGSYEVRFDGANLASGMYFYSVEANGVKEMKKMVLLK
ncbi:MAG: T9SS type A sorting domain-containing protein [Ignavibacteria bacterium]|nr:T9SS type A sorting domain-containing protein [Ignavibacteria bacterium]